MRIQQIQDVIWEWSTFPLLFIPLLYFTVYLLSPLAFIHLNRRRNNLKVKRKPHELDRFLQFFAKTSYLLPVKSKRNQSIKTFDGWTIKSIKQFKGKYCANDF